MTQVVFRLMAFAVLVFFSNDLLATCPQPFKKKWVPSFPEQESYRLLVKAINDGKEDDVRLVLAFGGSPHGIPDAVQPLVLALEKMEDDPNRSSAIVLWLLLAGANPEHRVMYSSKNFTTSITKCICDQAKDIFSAIEKAESEKDSGEPVPMVFEPLPPVLPF